MPRELKTNGIYSIKCTLTGEPAGTTPQVFADRAKRYGVDVKILKDNYIGRTGAKLLSTLVNERGVKAPDAIKQIRAQFEIVDAKPIEQKIVDQIVTKVTAKAKKAKDASQFESRKAAALAKLLGEAPVAENPAATVTEPTKPDKPEAPAKSAKK